MDDLRFKEYLLKLAGWGGWFDDPMEVSNMFDHEFTHDQLTEICYTALEELLHFQLIEVIVSRLPLTDDHVDILLNSRWGVDVGAVFTSRIVMTPAQIEFGLTHELPAVRDAAFNHPCCTDEQKVKYSLKRNKK